MALFMLIFCLFWMWLCVHSMNKRKEVQKVLDQYPNHELSIIKGGYVLYDQLGHFVVINKDKPFEFYNRHVDGYEIFRNDTVVHKGSRALVGGLTFGLVGAVVGGVSGKSKLSSMGIDLYADGKHLKLDFIIAKCKKTSLHAQSAEKSLHNVIAILKKGQ